MISKYGVTLTTKKTENKFRLAEDNYYGLEEAERKNLKSKKYLGDNTLFVDGFLTNKAPKIPLNDKQLRDFTSISNIFVKSNVQSTKDGLSNKKKMTVSFFRPSDETNIIDATLEKYNDKENAESKKKDLCLKYLIK